MFTLLQYTIPLVLLAVVCRAENKPFCRDDYTYDEKHHICYKLHIEEKNWYDANNTCEQDGTILASPIDKGLVKVYRTLANEHGVVRTFVGLHPGEWRSVEGISLATLEENIFGFNLDKSSPCAVLNYGHLISANCSELNPFVCYKRDIQAAMGAACDTAAGYEWMKETGHCYKFHNVADTWKRALGTCLSENAYLTIINSEDEAKAIKRIIDERRTTSINSNDNGYIHVGIINWEKDGKWFTIAGEPLETSGFKDWAASEPNNLNNVEYCGSLYVDGLLNDISCNQRAVFVCEKDVNIKINLR